MREYWNRYLLRNELPIGVVSGPANVWPREWQRAWRACYAGDEQMAATYKHAFERFGDACEFLSGGKRVDKTIACVKKALQLEGIVSSDVSVNAQSPLTAEESKRFAERYDRISNTLSTEVGQESRSKPVAL
jgi:dihydrodipicolinate synthase/N-acetylneuraminate lyase